MLKSLYIKNYALIDSLEIDFNSGFSVMTGETGAGKSIILGALSLILGQRADIKSIKQDEEKCIIEGKFDVSAYDLKSFCEENEIDYDAESYILRREIYATGKSRGFINDSPVNLNSMRLLGSRLIDIHSQHQNLLLTDDAFQMQVVDILAGNKIALSNYQNIYTGYKKAERRLSELKKTIEKNKDEEDFLVFQYKSLKDANLKLGEQADLESEQKTLSHAEDIQSGLSGLDQFLSNDEGGIIQNLHEGLNLMKSLAKIYDKSEAIYERLHTAYIDLQDLSSDVEKEASKIEYKPERLQELQARLDTIYTLEKRFKLESVEELIVLRDDLAQQIDDLDSSDLHIEELEKELAKKRLEVLKQAKELSESRKEASVKIEVELVSRLSALGMPNLRFKCDFAEKEPDNTGMDELNFLFSANKNVPLQLVAEIASGGEISRLMLCLKSMIAGATALPSIIFDEIDTGVSGEIADKMGNIMQDFGGTMQVLAITHLPQIAAKGETHYKVYKSDDADTTTTRLVKLTDEERLEEIAGMLSGAKLTEAALTNAREMLGYN